MILKSTFFIWMSLILITMFIIFIWVFPIGGSIDLYLIQPWVSSIGTFPYKNNWYLAKLDHTYVKQIVILIYASYFFLWCGSFKFSKLKSKRWQYGYMFWVSMLCTCLIGFIKAHSAPACPWYMTHETATGFIWDFSATAGHCFPGGHASTGFALLTGYFVYRLNQQSRAWFYLVAGTLIGFGMGWAQMMRGAHFLSHNLWTMWFCLAINFLCYAVTYRYHQQFLHRKAMRISDMLK